MLLPHHVAVLANGTPFRQNLSHSLSRPDCMSSNDPNVAYIITFWF